VFGLSASCGLHSTSLNLRQATGVRWYLSLVFFLRSVSLNDDTPGRSTLVPAVDGEVELAGEAASAAYLT
jgi:hypothetical protein